MPRFKVTVEFTDVGYIYIEAQDAAEAERYARLNLPDLDVYTGTGDDSPSGDTVVTEVNPVLDGEVLPEWAYLHNTKEENDEEDETNPTQNASDGAQSSGSS